MLCVGISDGVIWISKNIPADLKSFIKLVPFSLPQANLILGAVGSSCGES